MATEASAWARRLVTTARSYSDSRPKPPSAIGAHAASTPASLSLVMLSLANRPGRSLIMACSARNPAISSMMAQSLPPSPVTGSSRLVSDAVFVMWLPWAWGAADVVSAASQACRPESRGERGGSGRRQTLWKRWVDGKHPRRARATVVRDRLHNWIRERGRGQVEDVPRPASQAGGRRGRRGRGRRGREWHPHRVGRMAAHGRAELLLHGVARQIEHAGHSLLHGPLEQVPGEPRPASAKPEPRRVPGVELGRAEVVAVEDPVDAEHAAEPERRQPRAGGSGVTPDKVRGLRPGPPPGGRTAEDQGVARRVAQRDDLDGVEHSHPVREHHAEDAARHTGNERRDPQAVCLALAPGERSGRRSEEHTSELQSPYDLVCRL